MANEQKYSAAAPAVQQSQTITLENRNHLTVTGVNGVSRCDENEIIMATVKGILIIRGSKMYMSKLTADGGGAVVDGEFDSVEYGGDERRDNFFSRLFR